MAILNYTTKISVDKTAAEINYVASIEQSLREGVLARFWGQFQIMISTMQRRICSADNIRRARAIVKLRKKQDGIVRRESPQNF